MSSFYVVSESNEKWYYKNSTYLVSGLSSAKWYKRKSFAVKIMESLNTNEKNRKFKVIEIDNFGNRK